MNKTLKSLIFLFAFLPMVLSAEEIQTDVELRVGAFFPTSSVFRNLYQNVVPSYQIEASVTMCNCYSLWTGLYYTTVSGKNADCDVNSRVNLYTWSLGVKSHFCLNSCTDLYFGIGATCANTRVRNTYCCFKEKETAVSIGGIIKSGLAFRVDCNWFIDVFADYIYQPVHFDKNINVGGLITGLGVGYTF